MKRIDLVCNFIALAFGMFSSVIMFMLEYQWVTDPSMHHTGIKWAGGLLCIVCVLLVYLCVKELVSTIKGKE